MDVEIEGGFGNVESSVDEDWIHGRSRLSLVDTSSRLRQRFEFIKPKAEKLALPDVLKGTRGEYELFSTCCGVALTTPQLGFLQTFT